MQAKRLSTFQALVGGWLVVGSFDICYAIIFSSFRGVAPTRVLQSVASGLLGRASYDGGIKTAILGLALHYFIAFCVVAFYWLASRWIAVLTRHAVILGSIYGILVYLFMNFVVLPLSAAGKPRFSTLGVTLSLIVHAFLIGLPSALFAKWSRPDTRS